MTATTKCQCGQLAKWAGEPGVPIEFDPQTGTYVLKLSDTVVVPDPYCVFCGGHVPFHRPKNLPFCQCKLLETWEKDPTLPIEISGTGNSYELRCVIQGHPGALHIWFCPACGGTA